MTFKHDPTTLLNASVHLRIRSIELVGDAIHCVAMAMVHGDEKKDFSYKWEINQAKEKIAALRKSIDQAEEYIDQAVFVEEAEAEANGTADAGGDA